MNNYYNPYPYYVVPMCNCRNMQIFSNRAMSNGMDANYYRQYSNQQSNVGDLLIDQGKEPFVVNINQASRQNNTFRTAIWTGDNLQITLMSINVGEDVGLELHSDADQFLRIEEGQGLVQMGKDKDDLSFVRHVFDDSAIFVPAGIWHNLTNIGNIPLKLYSIYAPPEHPFGTIHNTKADDIAAGGN